MSKESRNSEALLDFYAYCEAHPDERFWQALRNWSGHNFVYVSPDITFTPTIKDSRSDHIITLNDTFHWEGKDK